MLGALTNADVISNISTVSRTYSPFFARRNTRKMGMEVVERLKPNRKPF